ncbi:MAG TPA: OmpA family protein [Chitinophagaceae bacterium]
MLIIKRFVLGVFFLGFAVATNAQVKKVMDRTKQKAKDKTNQKIDNTVDNAIDSAFSKTGKGIKNAGKGKTDSTVNDKKTSPLEEKSIGGNDATGSPSPSMEVYRKFDFVPGEKVMVIEDFSQDAVGDFPDKWNTNSGGEIVTIDGKEGKWLMVQSKGLLIPEFITSLPENFTFEFDLVCNPDFDFYSTALFFDIAALKNQADYMVWKQYSYENRNGVEFRFHPMYASKKTGFSEFKVYDNGKEMSKNQIVTGQFYSKASNHVKISVWRQKQRIRIYMNEEKIWDIPKALNAGMQYNSIIFALGNSKTASDRYYIGNLRLAVGAPDTRNKLVTEGKFVTRGILFDVGKDVIKPQSYGALKDIAGVLKENPDLKVKIIGHTDSDGDDKSNLDLSKQRAIAVKNALINEFGIDGSRMETDGKGEVEPADKNSTAEGKANNRRVEFIKF